MSEWFLMVLVVLLFASLWALLVLMEKERREWITERKDLLNRIQASNFAEYANQVIREKVVDKPKEPVDAEDIFIS